MLQWEGKIGGSTTPKQKAEESVSWFLAVYQTAVCWLPNKAGTVCKKVQASEPGPLIVQYAQPAPRLHHIWLQEARGVTIIKGVRIRGKFGFQHDQNQNFTLNKRRRKLQGINKGRKHVQHFMCYDISSFPLMYFAIQH